MFVGIVRHDTSDIVQLSDGSRWRIWPGDVAATLQWFPTTELQIEPVEDKLWSHVLINRADGSCVRVIDEPGPLGSFGNGTDSASAILAITSRRLPRSMPAM
jgi:hypothetical protein